MPSRQLCLLEEIKTEAALPPQFSFPPAPVAFPHVSFSSSHSACDNSASALLSEVVQKIVSQLSVCLGCSDEAMARSHTVLLRNLSLYTAVCSLLPAVRGGVSGEGSRSKCKPGPPATLLHEIFKAKWCELLFCRKGAASQRGCFAQQSLGMLCISCLRPSLVNDVAWDGQ